jgi:hypothetical protein
VETWEAPETHGRRLWQPVEKLRMRALVVWNAARKRTSRPARARRLWKTRELIETPARSC